MKLLVVGDFCPQAEVASELDNGNFDKVLGEVKPIVESSDYSIANFECACADYGDKQIQKYGPALKCSEKGLEALKWAGFKCVTLANNHFYDYGEIGVNNTLKGCIKNNLDYVGGGRNLIEASSVLYKNINGVKIAVINCCENEFSISTDKTGGSNPLNIIHQYNAIKSAKTKADYIIVIVHGGHEYYQLPSPRMKETYHFFIDLGADVVINHHQHCFSGYEVYKEKPIFYGLGNFCFCEDSANPIWYEGLMCILNFSDKVTFEVLPFTQCKHSPSIHMERNNITINNTIEKLCKIISDDNLLFKEYEEYLSHDENEYLNTLEPYGRILLFLKNKNLIKSGLTRRRLLKMYNLVSCESHRDRLKYFLMRKSKEV